MEIKTHLQCVTAYEYISHVQLNALFSAYIRYSLNEQSYNKLIYKSDKEN